ncbi:hypothetical protein FOH38_10570 [Lysinibacillus fusiformis]|nr:hypothetical protein FOH38_10570 [Lysinibacillus fusiformis]
MCTFENTDRQLIRDLMKRTVEGIAVSFGAEVDFRWFDYLPVVNNASVFADVAKEAVESIGYLAVEAKQSPGGEDFAYYQTLKPGLFV